MLMLPRSMSFLPVNNILVCQLQPLHLRQFVGSDTVFIIANPSVTKCGCHVLDDNDVATDLPLQLTLRVD